MSFAKHGRASSTRGVKNLNIVVVSPEKFGNTAADIVQRVTENTEAPNITFPTGDSPLPLYRELVNRYQHGKLSLANVQAFGLDEWGELEPGHPIRCISRMKTQLYSETDIPVEQIYYLEPNTDDLDVHCEAYDKRIADMGGLTLSILGIGINGHIGFNEPGSKATVRTRKIQLADRTLNVSQKYGFDKTPSWGVTLGLATLLESKEILILATGAHKAEIVHLTVNGPETSDVPSSLMRRHPNCTLLLDEAAAQLLKK
ncbi:glucosamine-6-phosphate deaminase [Alicyclobacillaceae bacterium I2511]|nr:glucosamine-6-phosphate deaminase [Alicyclobacillaceae bacterium I2511]